MSIKRSGGPNNHGIQHINTTSNNNSQIQQNNNARTNFGGFEPNPSLLNNQNIPQTNTSSTGGTFKAGLFPRNWAGDLNGLQGQAQRSLQQVENAFNWRMGRLLGGGFGVTQRPGDQAPPIGMVYGAPMLPGDDPIQIEPPIRFIEPNPGDNVPPIGMVYGAPMIPGDDNVLNPGDNVPPIGMVYGAPMIPGDNPIVGPSDPINPEPPVQDDPPPIGMVYGAPMLPGDPEGPKFT